MITNAWQIFHTSTADQDDRVFLKVVSFTRNVCDDFEAVCKTNLRHLTESGVRLFGRTGHNLRADAAAEGALRQSGALGLDLNLLAPFTDELVDRWHETLELVKLRGHGRENWPDKLDIFGPFLRT
jgi:hypothetical protein